MNLAPSSTRTRPLATMQRRAGELRNDLRFLLRADDPDFVYYIEARGRGFFLRASPIDVSRMVREALFDRFRTVVLTSATLAVDGSFDYVKGRLGLRDADEIRVPSEFDFGAAGAAVPAAADASAEVAGVRRGRGARSHRAR